MKSFLSVPGELIEVSELIIEKALSFVSTVLSGYIPHIFLIECKRNADTKEEIVIFEIEIEVGQSRVYDIRNKERIAVVFDPNDKKKPDVLALREDFPQTPHQNLKKEEFPRSLCLFDEEYEDMKLYWTPTFLLKQVINWLKKTANGNLHKDDQRLEPFLIGSPDYLIIPEDMMSDSFNKIPQISILQHKSRAFLFVKDIGKNEKNDKEISHLAIKVSTPVVEHGIINFIPETLEQLHNLLNSKTGMDLLGFLRVQFSRWYTEKPSDNFLECHLIVILLLPKKRYKNSNWETIEERAFLLPKKIAEIGKDIGTYGWVGQYKKENVGLSINEIDKTKTGSQIKIVPLTILYALSRNLASKISGERQRENKKIVAVGLGALGSQIFFNLVRSGFGEWTLIDKDFLLPHNLSKHALTNFVGYPKSDSLVFISNNMISGDPIAKSIVTDVLNPGDMHEEVMKIFDESDIILEMSVSIAVERYISRDLKSKARRISIFLTPSGADSVLLVEDINREDTLDFLEMQYYRHLINDEKLENHLQYSTMSYRYSNSCREVSNLIPQDLVALHAANCCRILRKIVNEEKSNIIIFQTNSDDFTVTYYNFEPGKMLEHQLGEWRVCMDNWFINKISKARTEKLPNETGGILVGSFDMLRKIVYIVDIIPSPPDSEEWPTLYIRGNKDLTEKLQMICKITDGKLGYVGEWHSHPVGYKPIPSQDDKKVFDWISDRMRIDAYPGVMLIIGEENKYRVFVDTINY
jgi:hypothetical protein